jgi:hypothetical protein
VRGEGQNPLHQLYPGASDAGALFNVRGGQTVPAASAVTPDVRVVIVRDQHRIVDCKVVDEATMAEIDLPITGFEYDHRVSEPGCVKLSLHGYRVFFEDV